MLRSDCAYVEQSCQVTRHIRYRRQGYILELHGQSPIAKSYNPNPKVCIPKRVGGRVGGCSLSSGLFRSVRICTLHRSAGQFLFCMRVECSNHHRGTFFGWLLYITRNAGAMQPPSARTSLSMSRRERSRFWQLYFLSLGLNTFFTWCILIPKPNTCLNASQTGSVEGYMFTAHMTYDQKGTLIRPKG